MHIQCYKILGWFRYLIHWIISPERSYIYVFFLNQRYLKTILYPVANLVKFWFVFIWLVVADRRLGLEDSQVTPTASGYVINDLDIASPLPQADSSSEIAEPIECISRQICVRENNSTGIRVRGRGGPDLRQKRNALVSTNRFWTGAVLPYTISKNNFESNHNLHHNLKD